LGLLTFILLAVVLHHETVVENKVSLHKLIRVTNYSTPAYAVLHNEKRERNEQTLHDAYPEMPNNTYLGFVYAK